jgi:PAS domain S-box-containing protein
VTSWPSTTGDAVTGSAGALESMPIGLIVLDDEWRVVYINAAGEAVVGYTRGELVGRSYWEAFPANVDNEFGRTYREVVATGRSQLVEAFYPEPLNRWFEVRAVPGKGELALYFSEVTERRRAQERLALLARIGAELAGTLDATSVAGRLPPMLVPTLASWCSIDLLDDDGVIRRIGTAPDTAAAHSDGVRTVLPIHGRERVLGELVLGHGHRRTVDDGDLSTAHQVADRLGVALDNARLYEQQRGLAEALQRSLLTAPPQLDLAEIAVRYLPASEAARVGGDWYDAFTNASGTTTLVIGDVVGHDTAATAAMGQLRSLLRGIAVAGQGGPSGLLTALDEAMAQLRVGTYATVAVACLEPSPDGGARLTWANAGHPAPLVLTPDGAVSLPGSRRGELMLGVDARAPRTESTLDLVPGATVLLYSDGLIENRERDLDEGTAKLRAAATELAHLPLDRFCDELVDRLVDGRPEDDVALVAVRINP